MTGDRYLSKEDFYSLFSGVVKISFFYTTPRLTNLGLDLGQKFSQFVNQPLHLGIQLIRFKKTESLSTLVKFMI